MRPSAILEPSPIPDSLAALIASRLDGLEAGDRALISDAAVLGQTFTSAGLGVLAGRPEADLEAGLRRLVRREILSIAADPRSPERGQYAFVQALIREVAYNTLSRPERKARHLAAARYLESVGADELAGALANHYLAAQANAPGGPERDALAGQARIALGGAAERAAALGSHEPAIAYLEQALAITSDPGTRIELLTRLGDSAAKAARYQLAESSFEQSAAIAREAGDRVRAAAAVAAIGEVLVSSRRPADAVELLEPAVAEFADLPEDPGVLAIRSQLARALHFLEAYRESLAILEQVLPIAERDDHTALLADALVTKGGALEGLGRVREGLGVMGIGVDVARTNGHVATVLRGRRNQAASLGFEVDAITMRATNDELLQLARRAGDRSMVMDTLQTIGWTTALFECDAEGGLATWADALSEDVDPAEEAPLLHSRVVLLAWRGEPLDDALARLDGLVHALSQPGFAVMPRDARGWIALANGRFDDAIRLWTEAIGSSRNALSIAMVARAALWAGDLEHAARWADRFIDVRVHLPASEIRERSIAAGIAALRGDVSEAAAQYPHVLDDWRRLGHAYEVALTAIDMASVLDPRSDIVLRAAEEARLILERMGARPMLDRLDAAMARTERRVATDSATADRSALDAQRAG